MTAPAARAELRGDLTAPERALWVELPALGGRVSATLAQILHDGSGLVALPWLALVLTPAALLIGLLFGATHLTFDESFTESLVFMMLAAAIGVFSGQAGLGLLVGFAAGDFFVFRSDWSTGGTFAFQDAPLWEHVVSRRVPLLIQYAVLALLVTSIPVVTKAILAQVRSAARLSPQGQLFAALVGHATLTFAFVWLWTQSSALLIRPVFTWTGSSPTDAAIVPLQEQGLAIAFAALIGSVARIAIRWRGVPPAPAARRVDELEAGLSARRPTAPPAVERIPLALRVVARAGWATLILAGLYFDWFDALLMAAMLLAFTAARAGLLPVPLGDWPSLAHRVPILLRVALALAIIFVIGNAANELIVSSETFRPLVVLVGVSLAVFLLVLPPAAPTVRPAADGSTASGGAP